VCFSWMDLSFMDLPCMVCFPSKTTGCQDGAGSRQPAAGSRQPAAGSRQMPAVPAGGSVPADQGCTGGGGVGTPQVGELPGPPLTARRSDGARGDIGIGFADCCTAVCFSWMDLSFMDLPCMVCFPSKTTGCQDGAGSRKEV